MGLYISNVKNYHLKNESLDSNIRCISRRKASHVFFSFNNSVYLYFNHSVSKICELEDVLKQYVIAVCQYAFKNHIDAFEILLDKELEINQDDLEYSLDYLYSHVSQTEDSIGLLVRSEYFIEENEELLDFCGVVYATQSHVLSKGISPKSNEPYFEMITQSPRMPGLEGPQDVVIRKTKPSKGRPVSLTQDLLLGESFHNKFMRFYIESEMDAPEVYNRGGISRQVFSKILSSPDFTPKKETILCLIIGLELSVYKARELLDSAGFSLSSSLPVDAVVERHIRDGDYDIDLINIELNERRCPLLGWRPREERRFRERYRQ